VSLTNIQRVAVLSKRLDFEELLVVYLVCSPDLSSFNELCTQADQNMFSKVLNNTDHVLHHLLTPVHNTSHSYSLRPRAHDRELPDRLAHLTDCNFITRMLFYQVY